MAIFELDLDDLEFTSEIDDLPDSAEEEEDEDDDGYYPMLIAVPA